MKVKKYVAPTMPEAMQQIRKELGPEAVILNSKNVSRGGFMGLFKKRYIEVAAALDPNPATEKNKQAPEQSHTSQRKSADGEQVLGEIKQLQKMVEAQTINDAAFPAVYQAVYQKLINQELDADLAGNLLENVLNQHKNYEETAPDQDRILHDLKQEIENRLSTLHFGGLPNDKQVIQFVGPTGAGKTTTIAKVAAFSMMQDNKHVALITSDIYRIAAVEQLKTYAEILSIPLEVVYNADDYRAAIEKFASYDTILVDTAGRNFLAEKYVQDLQQTISFSDEKTETFLVLPLTAKTDDTIKVYNQFQHLPIYSVIFTKTDETRQYGNMLNIALNNGLGISFLTNGQDVPDDILSASPQTISELIAGDRHEI